MEEQSVQCDFCGNYITRIKLAKHLRDCYEEVKRTCRFCGLILSSSHYCTDHEKLLHNPVREIKCKICKCRFQSAAMLNAHLTRTHSKKHHAYRKLHFNDNNESVDSKVKLEKIVKTEIKQDNKKPAASTAVASTSTPIKMHDLDKAKRRKSMTKAKPEIKINAYQRPRPPTPGISGPRTSPATSTPILTTIYKMEPGVGRSRTPSIETIVIDDDEDDDDDDNSSQVFVGKKESSDIIYISDDEDETKPIAKPVNMQPKKTNEMKCLFCEGYLSSGFQLGVHILAKHSDQSAAGGVD